MISAKFMDCSFDVLSECNICWKFGASTVCCPHTRQLRRPSTTDAGAEEDGRSWPPNHGICRCSLCNTVHCVTLVNGYFLNFFTVRHLRLIMLIVAFLRLQLCSLNLKFKKLLKCVFEYEIIFSDLRQSGTNKGDIYVGIWQKLRTRLWSCVIE